jgi:hypothetical protein
MITLSDDVYAELCNLYIELLSEAKYLYNYYPNNFRYTEEEYFKKYEPQKLKLLKIGLNEIKDQKDAD